MKASDNLPTLDSRYLGAMAYLNDLDAVKVALDKGADVNATFEGMTALYLAALRNNLDMVDELIRHQANVNSFNKEQITPLHIATAVGNTEIMEKLLSAGADVNALTLAGCLPISYAHATNSLKAVAILLQHGSFLDLSQNWLCEQFLKYLDFYPSFHPKKYDSAYLAIIKESLKKGFCHGFTKLHRIMADKGRENEFIEYLIEISKWDQNFDVLKNTPELESMFEKVLLILFHLDHSTKIYSHRKFNPLANNNVIKDIDYSVYTEVFSIGFVFQIGEIENLLTVLLNENKTINFSAPNYQSGSWHIISLKKIDSNKYEIFDSNSSLCGIEITSISGLMSYLKLITYANNDIIEAQIIVDVKKPTSDQINTYVEIKNNFSNYIMAKRIKDKNVNLEDKLESTSLHAAINANDKEMTFKLLENGAAIKVNKNSVAPMYLAAQSGNGEIIKKLLEYKDNVDTIFGNDSALGRATSFGHVEAVRVLIQNNATIDLTPVGGVTPLFMACQEGFVEIAELLINAKANVNFCFAYKNSITGEPRTMTPIGVAIQNNHQDIINLLIKNGAHLPTTQNVPMILENTSDANDEKNKKSNNNLVSNHQCEISSSIDDKAINSRNSNNKSNEMNTLEYTHKPHRFFSKILRAKTASIKAESHNTLDERESSTFKSIISKLRYF